jgi:hypothetical protein
MLRRMSSGRDGMPFAGAFLISRLGGSRRRFGRTIALWGLNRFLLFAAPSVLVPPDQSTHRLYIVLPRQRRRNRPDKPKTLNHLPAAKRLRPSRLQSADPSVWSSSLPYRTRAVRSGAKGSPSVGEIESGDRFSGDNTRPVP